MKKIFLPSPRCMVLLAVMSLTACGDTRVERAGSGAVIGGVAGIAVGAACCMDPFDGAIVGGAIGSASGAMVGAILSEPLFFNHEAQYWPYDLTAQ